MSRKGSCWDNALMERFFLNLKIERVWQRQYANHQEAILDVTDFMVGFYNCQLGLSVSQCLRIKNGSKITYCGV